MAACKKHLTKWRHCEELYMVACRLPDMRRVSA